MKLYNRLTAGLLFAGLSLNAFEPSCFYDYGYPPPFETSSDLGDLVMGAEWLFLKSAVDDLYFAEKGIIHRPNSISTHREMPSLKWDSGVRASLGYILPLDQWALGATYIYYRTEAEHSAYAEITDSPEGSNSYLVPVLAKIGVDATTEADFDANGKWNWNLNLFDVDLSRISYLNRAVFLRPNVGFRCIWSRQHYPMSYVDSPKTTSEMGLIVKMNNENNFTAFGIKLGIDTTWNLGFSGLSFFGNADWALLNGTLEMHQAFKPLKQKDHHYSMKQMIHGAFGLEWMTSFNCDSMFLLVKAGWEQFFFPNFNRLTARVVYQTQNGAVSEPYSVEGDMGLYGLSLGATLVF